DVADRYQVVTTSMADIRERVVLGEERESRAVLRANARAERRLEAADAALLPLAPALEERRDRRKRVPLLVGELGMRVDVPREQREVGGLGRGQDGHVAVYWLTQPFPLFLTRRMRAHLMRRPEPKKPKTWATRPQAS